MGLLYKGLSVWVQSRLDHYPKDTYIHTSHMVSHSAVKDMLLLGYSNLDASIDHGYALADI